VWMHWEQRNSKLQHARSHDMWEPAELTSTDYIIITNIYYITTNVNKYELNIS
jgi:hypothetical protein